MIRILIPCSKNSIRFKGKNELLIPYTVRYLSKVQTLTKEPLQVFVALTDETLHLMDKFRADNLSFTPLILPDKVKAQHMQCLIQTALDKIKPAQDEPIVLLQLTQPLRSLTLIKDALQVYQSCPNQAVLSYVAGHEAWRVLDASGNYQSDLRPAGELLKIHDGAIYIFNRMTYKALWDKSPKSAVLNAVPALVDIDYKSQFNPDSLTKLCQSYM